MAVPSSLGSTSQLATLATRADEARGPPPTKFYELRDNLDTAVLRAASVTPASILEGSHPEQLRLTLFLEDEGTGEARFIDLDARSRLEGVRRHLAADGSRRSTARA
jgi:hypothetical protein